MKTQDTPINYKILKRDFLIVNASAGVALFMMAVFVLLQQMGILPSMPCLFHEIMHMYCPGCGGTRAGMELLRGHILRSLWCNPSLLIGLILVVSYEAGVIITLIKKNGKRYYIAKGWPAYGYVIFVFLFAIFRNVLLLGFQIDMLHDFIK